MSHNDQALLEPGIEVGWHNQHLLMPQRINVAVSPAMVAAIDLVIERDSVTLTEAVRRLVTYGDFIYRAAREDGCAILLQDGRGQQREVVISSP